MSRRAAEEIAELEKEKGSLLRELSQKVNGHIAAHLTAK
jgi:hypothetical protein